MTLEPRVEGNTYAIDFGPVLHQLEMDALFEDLAIRWQRIVGK